MNKLSALFLLVLLCFSLASCTKNRDVIGETPPSSVPGLESIVEPVSGKEPESESEAAALSEPGEVSSTAEKAPAVVRENKSEPPPVESSNIIHDPQSVASSNAERRQEVLRNVAPDLKLDVAEIERELLRLINTLRDDTQVTKLGMEDDMQFAARIRAAEALESFSHTRPNQTPYNTAFDEAGFSYAGKWHGENLSSLGFTAGMFNEKEIALKMFNGLKESPGHYQNMVGEKFVQAGIGVAVSYGDGFVDIASAQLFSSL